MPGPYPKEPRIGVGCLVFRDGKILLVKRKYPPSAGRWSIPGGHVELGEGVLETAARELEEETGLRGEPLGVVNVDDFIMYDDEGRVKYHYVLVTVLLDVSGGEPRALSDALDAGFFSLEEAEELELTVSTRGLLRKIREGLVSPSKVLKVNKYVLRGE
ncbi:MAG: NUDIX hydrolase [Desulfurococcales archaeon]|nr:NUDIX hydrolase [Desulfurococcales archaeon]